MASLGDGRGTLSMQTAAPAVTLRSRAGGLIRHEGKE